MSYSNRERERDRLNSGSGTFPFFSSIAFIFIHIPHFTDWTCRSLHPLSLFPASRVASCRIYYRISFAALLLPMFIIIHQIQILVPEKSCLPSSCSSLHLFTFTFMSHYYFTRIEYLVCLTVNAVLLHCCVTNESTDQITQKNPLFLHPFYRSIFLIYHLITYE